MGKASENERLKLAATYWNNLAVAFAVAAIIAPLVYATSTPEISQMPFLELLKRPGFWPTVNAVWMGAVLSFACRSLAEAKLAKIKD